MKIFIFLLQNPFLLSKWGCLPKTRVQSDENWPSYELRKSRAEIFSIFEKNSTLRKKIIFKDRDLQIFLRPLCMYTIGFV